MLLKQSNEIAANPGFSVALERALSEAAAFFLDDAALYGDGVGKPQGALTSANPARVTVTRAGAGAIAAADVLGMLERLHPALHADAVWIASTSAIDQLAGLHVLGTSSDHFLYSPSQGAGLPSTLLGIPIVYSEKSPRLGEENDLALVNFSQYALGLRQGLTIQTSAHFAFDSDETLMRGITRVDGQSSWLEPFAQKDRIAPALSWAVSLV